MFKSLYLLKKNILMLERLRYGTKFSDELFRNFIPTRPKSKTIEQLESQLFDFNDIINGYIPPDVKEHWEACDSTVYTDEFHHRKFPNEIENDISVQYFLDTALEILSVSAEDAEGLSFSLRLYDFNDFDVYFPSEEDAVDFIEKYGIDTCTAFEKTSEGDWTEAWSQ